MRKSVCILLVAMALGTVPQLALASGGPDGPLPPPASVKPKYPKLDSQLNRRVEQIGQVASNAIAYDAPLYQGSSVAVTVRLSGNASGVVDFLDLGGAIVANVGADYVEAYVPIALLVPLSEYEGVLWVETIIPPQPDVVSQGVALHGAPPWHARGFTGAGVKVGIIDAGFEGFGALLGSDLPSTVVARCYTSVGVFTSNLADCENGEVHGTAVAEAVADMAPDVSLYIANVFSQGDLKAVASWMVSQGVVAVNMSLGWVWDGPGDGTSPFSNSPTATVNLAVSGGAIWVNSAGNSAEDNWFGAYSDADANGWIEFSAGIEVNSVNLVAGQTLIAQARWEDDWGSASRDFNLFLFDGGLNLMASSGDEQSGAGGQNPYEKLSFTASVTGTYLLAIFHFAGAAPSWLQLNAFSGQALSVAVAATSIGNPAESANPGMLAVGAANWATTNTIEPFSSQGPTIDGRIKPDLVGVDGADSVTYGPSGFFGTSQASPHVAGLAALTVQQFPAFSPEQVASYLKSNALPRGASPNDTWGFGLASLPAITPGPPTGVTAAAGDGQATVSLERPGRRRGQRRHPVQRDLNSRRHREGGGRLHTQRHHHRACQRDHLHFQRDGHQRRWDE